MNKLIEITLTFTMQILITITITMITLITLINNNENIYKTPIITLTITIKICTSLYPHIRIAQVLTMKFEM